MQETTISLSNTPRWDWIGSITGLIGAAILALNLPWSAIGWLFFLVSNAAWFIYAMRKNMTALVAMQTGFALTTMIGIWRWF